MDSECPVLYVLICVIASSMESTIFTEMIASRYSVPQSSSVAGMISELIACALLLMNPSGVRQMILDNYGGVRMDGSNATIIGEKQGVFIADRNHITRVWMDHGFWPFLTTKLYIDQTGDI